MSHPSTADVALAGVTPNVSGNNLTGNHGPIACNDEDFDATSSWELSDELACNHIYIGTSHDQNCPGFPQI